MLGAYYVFFKIATHQSLKNTGLYLPTSEISHGHLYYGISRCGDPNEVSVYTNQSKLKSFVNIFNQEKLTLETFYIVKSLINAT